MTASILQGGSAGSASAVATLGLSLTGLTAGSTVEVFAALNHFYGITSVVGSVNGAYTLTDSSADDGSTAKLLVYRKVNVASGAETVTITYDASRANVAAAWAEVGGVAAASFDVTATGRSQTAPGTGTDATASNAATNTVQPAIIVGASWDLTGNAPAAGTGFTNALLADFAALGSSGQLRVEYKRITTTTSVTATFTATVGANTHLNVMNILDEATANYANLERSHRGQFRGSFLGA